MNAPMNAILCPSQLQINREQIPQHLQINANTYQMKQTSPCNWSHPLQMEKDMQTNLFTKTKQNQKKNLNPIPILRPFRLQIM